GPGDRLLEALPASAEVLRPLRLLGRLERGVAGQAAVGRALLGLAPASSPASPPDHGPVRARRHHAHAEVSLREVIGAAPPSVVRISPSGPSGHLPINGEETFFNRHEHEWGGAFHPAPLDFSFITV